MKQLIFIVIVASLLNGCVRMPTHETKVVDDRPRISFDVTHLENEASLYYVRIDGVDFGSLEQYVRDKNALPLLPGTHNVEILLEGDVIFTQKVYLGEKSSRVIKVVDHE